ncbi:MAG: lipoyl synthase [marine bacterium B5-7]|nr:MAG: lipoyl synthase [marine bacterium B5-7]
MTQSNPSQKQRGQDKLSRIPVKIEATEKPLKKPDWIRIRLPSSNVVDTLKNKLRANRLHTVCEEASCPNLSECFTHGTATFMIMGDKCTRRCSFCDVAHGRPDALDQEEPKHLAETIRDMALKYVVITSVDRDDLRDGGAGHYVACIEAIRELNPNTVIETLVPDYRGRMDLALEITTQAPPDVFNHNIETAPRLYKQARPGSDYQWSLDLLRRFKVLFPNIPTKSGMMLGLGETIEEVEQVMQDLRDHNVEMLTLGQYLQPTRYHMPVKSFVHPDEFDRLGELGRQMGFTNVASGPLVRSSYHADLQAAGEKIS